MSNNENLPPYAEEKLANMHKANQRKALQGLAMFFGAKLVLAIAIHKGAKAMLRDMEQ